jgi:DNA-binding CsgD family transcriptional regulator
MLEHGKSLHLPTLNGLLLNVHRAGQVVSYTRYRALMLEEMQALIPFSAACWAEASASPLEVYDACLHGCGPAWLQAYRAVMGEDPLLAAMLEHPGQTMHLGTLLANAKRARSRPYQTFRTTHGLADTLGTLWIEPMSGLLEFLMLWRDDAGQPFDEAERQLMELLMPHLTQAYRVARLRGTVGLPDHIPHAWALADEHGYLREASAAFVHALRARWPDWRRGQVPEALREGVRAGGTWTSGRLTIEVSPQNRFRYLEIRPASPLARLSPREREVALRYARGKTYTAIASELGIAPDTVRNLLAKCFRKLGVTNKVELAKTLA